MAHKIDKIEKINGHHANIHQLPNGDIIADVYIIVDKIEYRIDYNNGKTTLHNIPMIDKLLSEIEKVSKELQKIKEL